MGEQPSSGSLSCTTECDLQLQELTCFKFLASDSQEVTAFGKRDKMVVLKDDCHMKDNTLRKTVFEIDTSVMHKLPLRDIAVVGADGNDEFYSVEMGSVCFY